MTDPEFIENLVRYQDGALSPVEIEILDRTLRDDSERRRRFAEGQLRSMALHDHFRQDAFRVPEPSTLSTRQRWRLRPALATLKHRERCEGARSRSDRGFHERRRHVEVGSPHPRPFPPLADG